MEETRKRDYRYPPHVSLPRIPVVNRKFAFIVQGYGIQLNKPILLAALTVETVLHCIELLPLICSFFPAVSIGLIRGQFQNAVRGAKLN